MPLRKKVGLIRENIETQMKDPLVFVQILGEFWEALMKEYFIKNLYFVAKTP